MSYPRRDQGDKEELCRRDYEESDVGVGVARVAVTIDQFNLDACLFACLSVRR